MKRLLLSLAAGLLLAGATGCVLDRDCCNRPLFCHGSCAAAPDNCRTCCDSAACRGCGGRGCGMCQRQAAPPAPATVAYPYYTLRGPRDFLARNPQSIGP